MKKEKYELGSNKINKPQRGPGPKMGGEKAKDFKGVIKKLLNYSKKQKIVIYIAVIFAMLGSILTLVGPNQLTKLTDEITKGIQTGINMDNIWSVGTFLITIYILSYVISGMQGVMIANVVQRLVQKLRSDILDKINNLPMKYFAKASKGDVLSRVTNDADTIAQSLSQSVGTVISAVTLFLGSLLMMFITNIPLALTAILSTIIGFVLMTVVMGKSQKYFKSQQKNLGDINGHIEEMYAGHTVLKAYNGEKKAKEIFEKINKELKNSSFKAQAMSGLMMPMMTFIGNFGYVCVCIVGALLAINGNISFGIIVAFMIYIRLFTQPLGQIAQGIQNLQSGAAAAERVFEFIEEKEMEDESNKIKELKNVKGNVEFKNVHFGYEEDKIIIKDFSAEVMAGQKIAIVGPTGAGKTTIVNLLMRFYDMQSGDILIDGVSINDVPREEVHSQFCMVLQDTWLFGGTLRENIIYSTPNVNEEDLIKACEAVGLHHFVKTLPKAYDTVLTDALNLSQGQKQQITIARAMIADKSMLILDEATSSIDTRTEIQIQSAMDTLIKGRTSFVIAHRLSTIKNADLILVMKHGDIIEKGNHEELLSKNGFYAELYNSQFDKK